ncbi:MAG: A/G-specific adenine glycosylase [Erysipelotrichaceae bacterium]|nr:A/G-specific adenine glycosylase [Erysipelotrichaceae bacterium]
MYEFSKADADHLLEWYRKNKRDLPWRDTGDLYDVWLSEIMLQQTRVEAVKDHFIRFKKVLPDIGSLANVDDDDLMRLWEGLGYYSRARYLKQCAIRLIEEYDGVFPMDQRKLLKLPGIGPYTAGAILAIGYGFPYAAVDGNVLRVMTRCFGIRDDIRASYVSDQITGLINDFYHKNPVDRQYVRDLTQALMELGAMVCVPNGKPICETCPFYKDCVCRELKAYARIPYRSALKDRKITEKTVFVISDHEKFLLHKRPSRGLLAGMYEFLNTDGYLDQDEAVAYLRDLGFDVLRISRIDDARHIFTHREWHMKGYEVFVGEWKEVPEGCLVADREELKKLAIPSAFKVYTERYMLRESEEEE